MQVKLVKLYATKLELMDMLLGFLECFSIGEGKKNQNKPTTRILPTLPSSDMTELSYSKCTKKYCLLFRTPVIASTIAWDVSLNFFPHFIN